MGFTASQRIPCNPAMSSVSFLRWPGDKGFPRFSKNGPSIRGDGRWIFLYINKNKDFLPERGGSLSGITLWAMGQLLPGGTGSGFRGSVIDLVLYSGPVVKIVLVILLFFSILSWSIIFSKLRLVRLAGRGSKNFLRIFWEGRQFASIFAESKKLPHSPTAEIFRA